jgi:D-alanyl-D-alanine carboxypeptidase
MYRIYSSTKTFTGALILQLAAEGKLSLSDSMMKYILPKNGELDSTVTIRQLLNHASGFSDYTSEGNFQIQIIGNPRRIWQPQELLKYAKKWFDKGTSQRYSSTNYIILGMIAEKVVPDSTIEQLFRARFFNRLQLSDTYFPYREDSLPRPFARGYDNLSSFGLTPDSLSLVERGIPYEGIVSAAWATGGVVSTARDLAKWGYNYFGKRVIAPAYIDSVYASLANATNDDAPGYAAFLNKAIGPGFVGHGGASIGYRSTFAYNKDKDLAIAMTINQGSGDMDRVCNILMRVINDETWDATSLSSVRLNLPVALYPNPATGSVRLYLPKAGTYSVKAIDLAGRTYDLAREIIGDETEPVIIDISQLQTGLYQLLIENRQGEAGSTRLLVK